MIRKRERAIKAHRFSHPGASVALAVLAFAGSSSVLRSQTAEKAGQDLFQKRCSGCHALDADHEGPRLRGVVGRAAGTVKTFEYSDGLRNAKFTWDEATLDEWLTDTESVVPDNDMSFQVPKKEDRAAIISYLKSLSTP
jgi:cytochrome c